MKGGHFAARQKKKTGGNDINLNRLNTYKIRPHKLHKV